MANLRARLQDEFGIDTARLSPELRLCLERLETLENESDELATYMAAGPQVQRAAWRIVDGGRSASDTREARNVSEEPVRDPRTRSS